MSLLSSLAEAYSSAFGTAGIDWSLYDEQGILRSDPRYSYRDEVLARVTRVYDVVGEFTPTLRTRYHDLRAGDARSSLSKLSAALESSAQSVLSGAVDAGLTMGANAYKDAVLSLGAYIADGAALHLSLVMEDALTAGTLTIEEVREHAYEICCMADSFVRVNEAGGFEDLKTETAQAGLGVAWLAVLPVGAWWAISVIGIGAVLGLAYTLHGVFVTLPVQRKTIETCERLAEKGLIASSQECFAQMANSNVAAPWAAPLQTLTYVVIGGVGLYAVSLALPHLVRARREARA